MDRPERAFQALAASQLPAAGSVRSRRVRRAGQIAFCDRVVPEWPCSGSGVDAFPCARRYSRGVRFGYELLLSVIAFVATACAPAAYPVSPPHPLLGEPMPSLMHRTTLDGRPFDASRLTGRPVVIKFFAEYCEPCKTSLPAAQRVHERHPDVAFVGIDEDEQAYVADTLVRSYGLTFPVIHDASNTLAGRFRVTSMPTTFVVDPQGLIRWVGGEAQTEEELRDALAAAGSGQ